MMTEALLNIPPEAMRMIRRRPWLLSVLAGWGGSVLPAQAQALVQRTQADAAIDARLRQGGVVVAFRHALAPGTFDPPNFRLGECSTQRNLSDDGRAQARRIGAWFRERQLTPIRVRSSPWCRCLETAQLAFAASGPSVPWAALGSPRGATETTNAASLAELRAAVKAVPRAAGFEVWVTHMFVLSDLVGQNSVSGEGLLLAPDARDGIEVLGRLLVS
jgi:Histidine phosphatase superfamily (branch 1)